jgi:hypothetical protein
VSDACIVWTEWRHAECRMWLDQEEDVERGRRFFVLMELHRAIIYTTKMSKQVTKSHVRDAVHMYPVN